MKDEHKSMRAWKLTDINASTHGGTQWGPGVRHTAPGTGPLCTAGWVHYYRDPLLAVLLNPVGANFTAPRLWEGEAEAPFLHDGWLKSGCGAFTTVQEIPVPVVTTEQRVQFGIFCALEVSGDAGFRAWAEGWLEGRDRSERAARKEMAAAAVAQARWAQVRWARAREA